MKAEIEAIRTLLDQTVKSGPVATQTRRRVHKAVCAKLDALEAALCDTITPETVAPKPLPSAYELYYLYRGQIQNEPEDCIADPTAEEVAAWEYVRKHLAFYFEPKVTVDDLPYGNAAHEPIKLDFPAGCFDGPTPGPDSIAYTEPYEMPAFAAHSLVAKATDPGSAEGDRTIITPFPTRPASVDPKNTNAHEERMLKYFVYDHLPEALRAASAPWCELAVLLCHSTKPGPERTVALRKLLEGKDAAVRAALTPGC